MPDNILKLIPTSPGYIPDAMAQRKVRDLLDLYLPEGTLVRISVTDEIRFIDQGSNWERVLCPICGTELNIEWWQQAMDDAYRTQFTNLSVRLPCCSAVSSLNDLDYEWPAGFARFVIEISNPNTDLDDQQMHSLERILGCKLRKIWAHY